MSIEDLLKEETPTISYIADVEEEEGEEETVTLDFDNKKAYTVEEEWLFRDKETKEQIVIEKKPVLVPGKMNPVHFEPLVKRAAEEPEEDDEVEVELAPINAPEQPAPVQHLNPGDLFAKELQDIFFNSLVSKAVASLLKKHTDLDRDLEIQLDDTPYMGELTGLLRRDINKAMEQRRRELKAAYNGATVRYENIPDWAKGYVRDYIKDLVGEAALATERSFFAKV